MTIQEAFNNLPSYSIEIGVISMNKRKTTIKYGITNAELMYIHEYGSPLKNIPARPVLQMTIDYTNKHLLSQTIDKCINVYLSSFDESKVELELNKLCRRMENYARRLIYNNDGRLVANAPSTIKRKGYNHPLFQTGQLARSITCQLIKS